MSKLLIEEIRPEEMDFITEEKNGQKHHYIVGKFMQSECVNGNRRRYPKDIMLKEVEKYNKIYVNENRAFGELGHPDTPKINLDRVSHLIVSLKEDGNDFIGKARILDTPYGKIVQNILDGGGKLGVSSRGVGSVREESGVNVVQSDFRLATAADIVSEPSAPEAFVNGIMEEKSWLFESGVWKEEDLMKAKKKINEARRAELEYTMLEQFQKLMSRI